MILILSRNEQDNETDLVCRCLMYHEVAFRRVNVDDFLLRNVFVSQEFFVIDGEKFCFQDFDLVWIRRGFTSYNSRFSDKEYDSQSNSEINLFNFQEWNLFMKFLFMQIPPERMVNQARGYFADKIDQVLLAKEIGLPAPDSFYSNNASDLRQYESREIISKPGGNLGYLRRKDKVVKSYTEIVNTETLPPNFQTAFFQEKLEAQHEIRTLYLNGELFNCGMIKAENSVQHVDIKNQKGLRCHPVNLPESFAEKIREFMQKIGFRIGFIDILKTANGYQFIEMNPYGKFLFYSHACNFNFEHRIANFLINEVSQRR